MACAQPSANKCAAVGQQTYIEVLEAFHSAALNQVEFGGAAQLLVLPQYVLPILQHPSHCHSALYANQATRC